MFIGPAFIMSWMKKSKPYHNGRATRATKMPRKRKPLRLPDDRAPRRTKQRQRASFDDLLGRGATLWDDEEFERFQAWLREKRLSQE